MRSVPARGTRRRAADIPPFSASLECRPEGSQRNPRMQVTNKEKAHRAVAVASSTLEISAVLYGGKGNAATLDQHAGCFSSSSAQASNEKPPAVSHGRLHSCV